MKCSLVSCSESIKQIPHNLGAAVLLHTLKVDYVRLRRHMDWHTYDELSNGMPPSDGLVWGHTKERHDGKVTVRQVKREATTRNAMVIESHRLPLPNCLCRRQVSTAPSVMVRMDGCLWAKSGEQSVHRLKASQGDGNVFMSGICKCECESVSAEARLACPLGVSLSCSGAMYMAQLTTILALIWAGPLKQWQQSCMRRLTHSER